MPFRARRLLVLLVAATGPLALLPAAASAAPSDPSGTVVTGRVLDTEGHPLTGVRVLWETEPDDSPIRVFATTTGADGRFRAVRRAGSTDPAAVYFDGTNATGPTSGAGYLQAYLLDSSGGRVVVTPQPGRRITGGATALAIATGATGVVTGGDGEPLGGVVVFPVAAFAAPVGDVNYFPEATTDAQGRWTLRGLDPGDRTEVRTTFEFLPDGATGGNSPTGYPLACLGAVPDPCYRIPGAAGPGYVTLTPGQLTGGVDVALPSAAEMHGRLTDVDGHGIGNVIVYVFRTSLHRHDGAVPISHGVLTDSDGSWTYPGLFPDQYAVCYSRSTAESAGGQVAEGRTAPFGFTGECSHDSPMTAGVYAGTLYTPTAGQIVAVPDDTLVANGAATFRVVGTDGQPVPHATVQVGVLGTDGRLIPTGGDVLDSGRGTVAAIPAGRVQICVRAPGYVSTCPATAASPSVTVRPYLTVAAPVITMAPRGG